jgi:23S rRNA (cytosine1962-C5)-methyltransferase
MSTHTRRPDELSARPDNRRHGAGSEDDAEAVLAGSTSEDGYELLDAGHGERLERWGAYRLRRPDPRSAGLMRRLPAKDWDTADASYRGDAGRGAWVRSSAVPEQWTITHDTLTFIIKLAPFKHTGLFPEQALHWQWMRDAAARAGGRADEDANAEIGAAARPDGTLPPLRVLNLFAYTGAATIALARAGHIVTHVDASKPAIAWARENARANALPADAIRWIQDDVPTFVKRELRRGREYDAVLLDPPAFGRAPKTASKTHAIWRAGDDLLPLLEDVLSLLTNPAFIVINDYARDADASTLAWMLRPLLHAHGWLTGSADNIEAGRLCLQTRDGRPLDTGAFARWRR